MASLTRAEAAARAQLLRVSGYDVHLDLTAARESTEFVSSVTIRFAASEPGTSTFAEVKPAELIGATLNGAALDLATLAGNRLPLPGLLAENVLEVRARMRYSRSAEGLHRFTDPEDGEIYLYGQACLDEGQRIFACFDQPDLKAPITLSVSAPLGWGVWANAPGQRRTSGLWAFEPTKPLPTYLFTVLAGPFHSRHAEHDGIALGLVCRRSLAPHLDKDAAELFAVTSACLDRYHELFGIRYPFGKYDQAFVPEFNAGALEDPGCVLFRDEFLFRSAVTDADRELRAVVIAHEMAHMWFGDLVTMRWWDDLWLNESFAEYMGWRVAAEATVHTGALASFALGRKSWGYAADQRPSTHPVAPVDVADTAHAMQNFDGISYAKGASALRQLVAWAGDDAFLAGVRDYFAAHQFGNATFADLLAALSEASGRDLATWAELWLRTAQVNTLSADSELGPDGRLDALDVIQTAPPDHPTLRPHRIGIGIYDGEPAAELVQRVEVDLDPVADGGRTTVAALVGADPGRLMLLNDGDLTFAKVRLDPAGLAVLPSLVDPLARAVVWGAAIDACRDGLLPAAEFAALAAAGLRSETQVAAFADVFDFALGTAVQQYLPPSLRGSGEEALAETCLAVLAVAEPGGGRQLAAARALARCGPAHVLAGWLDGLDVPGGLAVDTDLRWSLLYRLVVLGSSGEAEIR
ncbi:MAG: aminopeptidase, partial [Cryptosporangiaceae bacterium]|nr:aminopeptidase [Cryptosporangiaceae bacterium]